MVSKTFFSLLLFFSLVCSAFSSNSSDGYKIGDKVSDFTINNYDGATYTLNSSGAKATVIMFWSTHCPFAQAYNERAKDLVTEFGSKGIAFWGINSNNTEPTDEVMNH